MGKTKKLIETLIAKTAKGNSFIELDIQMKLLFKGINTKNITDQTPDDPKVIAKIFDMAKQLGVDLE